jgi:hypothetical protein
MEVSDGKISEVEGVVNRSEPKPGINDKVESGLVGVRFLEKVADPFVVSGLMEKELSRNICVFLPPRGSRCSMSCNSGQYSDSGHRKLLLSHWTLLISSTMSITTISTYQLFS